MAMGGGPAYEYHTALYAPHVLLYLILWTGRPAHDWSRGAGINTRVPASKLWQNLGFGMLMRSGTPYPSGNVWARSGLWSVVANPTCQGLPQ